MNLQHHSQWPLSRVIDSRVFLCKYTFFGNRATICERANKACQQEEQPFIQLYIARSKPRLTKNTRLLHLPALCQANTNRPKDMAMLIGWLSVMDLTNIETCHIFSLVDLAWEGGPKGGGILPDISYVGTCCTKGQVFRLSDFV